ncbi:MAG: DUF554 domain-containing protein [Spirochaetia bacterium]|jgi:uncharacterized membrane protein YqgA involved in biofilm formation|nr:DUF554 domain-containing protein [Spirochaetia bacterium]
MIATIINCITVIIGSFIGMFLHKKINPEIKDVVFTSAGVLTLVIGMQLAFESQKILYVIISLFVGGILGSLWKIEDHILNMGSFLEKHFTPAGIRRDRSRPKVALASRKLASDQPVPTSDSDKSFAHGFLNASVLFCVGAMTIVGAIKAGAEGDYDLILMKSVLDGFMAVMFTAAMGIGVIFSVITILIYQGGLTLLATWVGPLIGESGLTELSGLGGILVLMIGINLLGLKEIKTANFLPGLFIILIFTSLEPWFLPFFT